MSIVRRWLFLLLYLSCTSPPATADMVKGIEAVTPRIGQRGTTVEVHIQGISLSNPRQIVFYQPGIRAVNLQPATPLPRIGLAHGGAIVEEVVCQFEIAPDCVPGEHPFRLLTATELSCIGTFHVSPFLVLDEGEENNAYSNDTPESALQITGNVTIRGQLGSGSRSDRDLYRVNGHAGERLSVEVDSARLADRHYGDSEYDLSVRILDQHGRLLAADDDNSLHLQDPVLSVSLLQDGPVYVEVQRSIFAPRETQYCIHIGSFHRPLAAFPPGGQIGTSQTVRFLGDAAGEFQRDLTVPRGDGSSHAFRYFGDAPSAVRLRASPYPNLLEDTQAEHTRVPALPVAINGIINDATDRDSYRFSVTKGDRWRVRVFAAALGSPIDAVILIRPLNPDGTLGPAEVELDDSPLRDHDIFGTGFRSGGGLQEAIDPSVVWQPAHDGEYQLEILDPSGSGGPTAVYRIEIESPPTVVQTLLSSATFDWTESTRVTGLAIPRGNRWTIDVSLPQGQWNPVPCDYELTAHGLPAGVRLVSSLIPKAATRWPLQFEADATAATAGAVFTLQARPVETGHILQTRCQQNVPFINHSGGDAWRTVRTDRYVLGVTEPAPFSVHVDPPSAALVRGGELAVPVHVTRHQGFSGPITIRCGDVPRSVSTPPPLILPPDQSECVLQLGAEANAPLTTVPLYVIGSSGREDIDDFLGTGHVRVSSRIIDVTIAQPYVELAAEPESIRRGESKAFVWTVSQQTPFEGSAEVRLLGLPRGVTVVEPFPSITRESTNVTFQLSAASEALLGQASGLLCEVHIPAGDQQIVQRTGRGTLRIDPSLE